MIIGVSGIARSGKDTVADYLLKYDFCKVALADPIKRICMDIYDFSEDQLWGDSKEIPDKRYPRSEHDWLEQNNYFVCKCCALKDPDGKTEKQCYLTPRFAAQIIGTEGGRTLYDKTWTRYALAVAETLLTDDYMVYEQTRGLIPRIECLPQGDFESVEGFPEHLKGVVISDCRFSNELVEIQNHGGILIRVKRNGAGLNSAAASHKSESEQLTISDDSFDYVIDNDGSLKDLYRSVDRIIDKYI